LLIAIADVDEGMSIREAGRSNGIPSSSLRGHLYGTTIHRKRSKVGVLTDAKEGELVEYLIKMQNLGYPLTIGQLRKKVGILTQTRVTPFTNGVLGPKWVKFSKSTPRVVNEEASSFGAEKSTKSVSRKCWNFL